MIYTEKQIKFFAVAVSLLFSLFVFLTDDIINRDGILYVNMAQAYLNNGLAATAQLYDWPFFSILVAYIHQITTLSIENSAYLLNALLFALLISTLVSISNKLLSNSRQLAIASILILCFSVLNEYREFIIRDIGYWAFCFLTLYRFMLFIKKPSLKNATLWQLFAVISILFRIEGVAVLLALPIYFFFTHPPKQALKKNVQLSYLFLIGLISISIISVNSLGINGAFGKLESISFYLDTESYTTLLNKALTIMETQVLNQFSEDYSALILISGLLVMLFYKLIQGVSFVNFGLYALSLWQKQSQHTNPYTRLLIYFTVINLIVLIMFLLTRHFISTRYCIVALLGILLLMLPRICAVTESFLLNRNKLALSLIGIVLFVSVVDSLTSSRSKSYIKDTAIWASDNLPDNSSILTGDQFIEYYFTSQTPKNTLLKGDITTYLSHDYLIIVEKRKNHELKKTLSSMSIAPIFGLSDSRGDKAVVYKVISGN